jgi:hypothetical protein
MNLYGTSNTDHHRIFYSSDLEFGIKFYNNHKKDFITIDKSSFSFKAHNFQIQVVKDDGYLISNLPVAKVLFDLIGKINCRDELWKFIQHNQKNLFKTEYTKNIIYCFITGDVLNSIDMSFRIPNKPIEDDVLGWFKVYGEMISLHFDEYVQFLKNVPRNVPEVIVDNKKP